MLKVKVLRVTTDKKMQTDAMMIIRVKVTLASLSKGGLEQDEKKKKGEHRR